MLIKKDVRKRATSLHCFTPTVLSKRCYQIRDTFAEHFPNNDLIYYTGKISWQRHKMLRISLKVGLPQGYAAWMDGRILHLPYSAMWMGLWILPLGLQSMWMGHKISSPEANPVGCTPGDNNLGFRRGQKCQEIRTFGTKHTGAGNGNGIKWARQYILTSLDINLGKRLTKDSGKRSILIINQYKGKSKGIILESISKINRHMTYIQSLGFIMKKRITYICIALISTVIALCSFQLKKDKVIILAGKGIVLNGDSILLKKTTYEELAKILKVKAKKGYAIQIWDGFEAETGESVSGTEFVKNVKYKTIQFDYVSQDTVNFRLNWISIEKSKDLEVKIADDLYLGDTNPNLQLKFNKVNGHDYISENGLTYNLYSKGISFDLDSIRGERILTEVSVHYTLNE